MLANVLTRGPLADFPAWSFDGSSTYQADGGDSDLILMPVRFVKDPLREGEAYLVLCEVLTADGAPHGTNTRRARVCTSCLKAGKVEKA